MLEYSNTVRYLFKSVSKSDLPERSSRGFPDPSQIAFLDVSQTGLAVDVGILEYYLVFVQNRFQSDFPEGFPRSVPDRFPKRLPDWPGS